MPSLNSEQTNGGKIVVHSAEAAHHDKGCPGHANATAIQLRGAGCADQIELPFLRASVRIAKLGRAKPFRSYHFSLGPKSDAAE